MTVDFVFFHIGPDLTLPEMLVNSIKKTNSKSKIIQLSDLTTPQVSLTDEIQRFQGNQENIMYFRAEAYLQANFNNPTIFIDTDMLVIKEITEDEVFGPNKYIFCERYFDNLINPEYLKLHDLEANLGKTLKQIFPFLGCFIGAKDNKIFQEIYKNFNKLDKKYRKWNGDQIALADTFKRFKKVGLISEKEYAYPISAGENFNDSYIIHFKGNNKEKMKTYYSRFFENKN